jgi:hypothetical protein
MQFDWAGEESEDNDEHKTLYKDSSFNFFKAWKKKNNKLNKHKVKKLQRFDLPFEMIL